MSKFTIDEIFSGEENLGSPGIPESSLPPAQKKKLAPEDKRQARSVETFGTVASPEESFPSPSRKDRSVLPTAESRDERQAKPKAQVFSIDLSQEQSEAEMPAVLPVPEDLTGSSDISSARTALAGQGQSLPAERPLPSRPAPKTKSPRAPASIFSKVSKFLPRTPAGLGLGATRPRQPNEAREFTKQLLEAEKIYREGLTSLKDLIAPSAIKINPSELEVSGIFSRSYFVLAYPRYLSSNWLAPVINLDIPIDISMFVYPLNSETILKKLRNKVGQIQSGIMMGQEKGDVRDPMMETALHDVEELRDRLIQGTEHYFRVSLYFTLYAATLEELNKYSSTLETILGSKLIVTKKAFLQMKQGYNSTLPLGQDELAISANLNTDPLSSTFPFVSSDLTTNDGILYGINQHNNSLILFDRFSMENANLVVFAKSGAGKSYAVKLEILRSLMMGASVIVIDPEAEYKHLSDSVGGVFLNVSLNSAHRINPFDLPRGIEGESEQDILRSGIVFLGGLMNILLGKLDSNEDSIMDRALWETYAKKDITQESGFSGREMPIMEDLVEILGGIDGGENLASRLSKYTTGTFSGLFDQLTNVDLN
ncbi:MAG: DUF87 domain-containing protein, partial [Patescibacteria group bacterium]